MKESIVAWRLSRSPTGEPCAPHKRRAAGRARRTEVKSIMQLESQAKSMLDDNIFEETRPLYITASQWSCEPPSTAPSGCPREKNIARHKQRTLPIAACCLGDGMQAVGLVRRERTDAGQMRGQSQLRLIKTCNSVRIVARIEARKQEIRTSM
jgi:hypothetical protein